MGELRKLRLGNAENVVTPYTAGDETIIIDETTRQIKVNPEEIATQDDLTDVKEDLNQLQTGKAHSKFVLESDVNSTGSIYFEAGADINLDIYDEMVIFIYQSNTDEHGIEWGTGQFGYITIRDVVNNTYIQFSMSPNGYINEKAPTLIKIKRLPSCIIMEINTGGQIKVGYKIRAVDYIDTIRWFSISANNATLYAGTTVEAYII